MMSGPIRSMSIKVALAIVAANGALMTQIAAATDPYLELTLKNGTQTIDQDDVSIPANNIVVAVTGFGADNHGNVVLETAPDILARAVRSFNVDNTSVAYKLNEVTGGIYTVRAKLTIGMSTFYSKTRRFVAVTQPPRTTLSQVVQKGISVRIVAPIRIDPEDVALTFVDQGLMPGDIGALYINGTEVTPRRPTSVASNGDRVVQFFLSKSQLPASQFGVTARIFRGDQKSDESVSWFLAPRPAVAVASDPTVPVRPTPDKSHVDAEKRRSIDDAFWYTPYVREIASAEDLNVLLESETDNDASNDKVSDALGFEPPEKAKRTRFDSPAHFPIPEFGQSGQRFQTRGAVIYEGMQFVYYPDSGRYRVRFITGTPQMPVVLRLRFVLIKGDSPTQFTLTLPEIKIPGNPESYDREVLNLVQVNGYLPVLKTGSAISIKRREGDALFGFGLTQYYKVVNR